MAALDALSIGILLGALLVLAGIMSSLVAMRFGAPLLLVFLIVGMLAGEEGLGGVKFDDVRTTYVVGSIALALILFDGGLRTRFATFRSVLGPAITLATAGVLLTAALTAPVAKYLLAMSWTEALLVGAVVASTDAAAVFFLLHARGLRLRPRVGATLEVESGSNDPFAVLLTLLLVGFLTVGAPSSSCSTGWGWRRGCTPPSWPRARSSSSASPRRCMPRAFSPSILPASWSATGRRAPTIRWWCFSMP